ncbi:MAG: PTS sugar transporter subunit IIA [Longimicrobiales bacterium]
MPGPTIRGVVVAHGPMATAMVDAVRRIAGDRADALVPVSNDGKGPDELRNELEGLVGEERAVVFTDLLAGSCGMAAMSSCRNRERRAVVAGVNLAMLLEFVFHHDLPLDELVQRVQDRGRASITQPVPRA